MQATSWRAASSARASLRAESSGSPWSHSSTTTRSRPNASTSRWSSLPGRRWTVLDQGRRDRPLAAAREHPPVAPPRPGQLLQGEAGRALLPRQLTQADGPGQAGVPLRAVGQDDEMTAHRIGHAVLRRIDAEGQLGSEHRGHADRPRRLGEAHHAVQPVVVGEGQRLQPQPSRFLGQLLGVGGAVQEAEVGVAVQLGVGHGAGRPCPPPIGVGGFEGLALPAPRRAVTAGVPAR